MKGLGRSAALLGLAGMAGLVVAFGPGAGVALAINDNGVQNDKNCVKDKNNNGGLFPNGILNNCNGVGVAAVAAGGGVGGPAGGPTGGVPAGGGGMAAGSPVLPLAGAGLGAALLTVGYAHRRRQQDAN
jgi:hypothetical protein